MSMKKISLFLIFMTFNHVHLNGPYHGNSSYWKKYKQALPQNLPPALFQIALGITLGDGSLYKTKHQGSKLKFEQGYLHKAYVEKLCVFFKAWTVYTKPYVYFAKKGVRSGLPKSYGFRTLSHPAFDVLWNLFMLSGKKLINQEPLPSI